MPVQIRQWPVSCLECGAHWWIDETSQEIDGPSFTPYAWTKVGRKKVPVPNLAVTGQGLAPTRPCQCAQEHHHTAVDPQLALSRAQEADSRWQSDRVQEHRTAAPVRRDHRVGRVSLDRDQLVTSIRDWLTNYQREDKIREAVTPVAAALATHTEGELRQALGAWFTHFARYDAVVGALYPEPSSDPGLFLEFLERRPDDLDVLGVPAVQRAIGWVRSECKKPDKERLGRWLGGTMKDHRPALLSHRKIQQTYSVFRKQLDRALKVMQQSLDHGDDVDEAWLKVVRECRAILDVVERAGLRREFLGCAEKHGKRGGTTLLSNLTHRLVAYETGAPLDTARRIVNRRKKGVP